MKKLMIIILAICLAIFVNKATATDAQSYLDTWRSSQTARTTTVRPFARTCGGKPIPYRVKCFEPFKPGSYGEIGTALRLPMALRPIPHKKRLRPCAKCRRGKKVIRRPRGVNWSAIVDGIRWGRAG